LANSSILLLIFRPPARLVPGLKDQEVYGSMGDMKTKGKADGEFDSDGTAASGRFTI